MSPNEGMSLPKWRCHKEVHADRIVKAWEVPITERENGEDSGYRWALAGGAVITVSLNLKGRVPFSAPVTSGYYVLYADGFESWSPAKAFEDGYELLPPR